MKKILFIALVVLGYNSVNAQQESWNWYFGNHAGVSFSSGSPVAFAGNPANTMEGSAAISDNAGNLLFYTDGTTVYTSQNTAMPNGTGLLGHSSSTQSAIILKLPASSTIYYVFTMDYNHDGLAVGTGFRYSIVDISLNGGLGDVTTKNVPVRVPAYEKLIAVCDGNGADYWVLINDWANDDIFSYHLTSAGFDTVPVMSNIGPIHSNNAANTAGYMKASAHGDKLALATWSTSSFELYDYNNLTGVASNHISVQSNDMAWTYGAEFSPDGTKLYGSKLASPGTLYQFDISSWNPTTILNSRVILGTNQSQYYYCGLQAGPDGKIYCAVSSTGDLGVINNPDSSGVACNYVNSGVIISSGNCRYGLPTFAPCYVDPTGVNTLQNEVSTTIYPNPSSTLLNVSFSNNIKNGSYKIMDVSGKVLCSSKITGKDITIDVHRINSGIYFLQLESNGVTVNKKILIEN